MTRAGLVSFACVRCGRWVKVNAWSRYTVAQCCPPCYRARAAALAEPILERFHQQRTNSEQTEMPDW